MTQGSVSGPHLFNLFINDLDIEKNKLNLLVKFADDTTILIKVCKLNEQLCKDIIDQYFRWSTINQMPCNIAKCRELVAQKKNKEDTIPVNGLKKVHKLKILGVTLQENNRFDHITESLLFWFLLLKTIDFCALITAIVLNRSLLGFESHSCETEMLILRDKVYLPIPPENIYVYHLRLLPYSQGDRFLEII